MKSVRSQKSAAPAALSRGGKAVQPENATFTVCPIGVVRTSIKQVADDCWGGLLSVIEIDPQQFKPESTAGLDQFSHAVVVFLLDRIAPESVHTGSRHPRGRADWPITGIFAQRAKDRPNRIGVTVCKIESVDGLRISVRELDAVDGTPVLDIKPYIREFGPREPVRQPPWADELMASYFKPGK
jgi:tRNA (adenine37-N6)-methyltransferase